MEKPNKIGRAGLYWADEMDTYLAQKDKEIGELVSIINTLNMELKIFCKDTGSITHGMVRAKSALSKHKTINE